jgi:methylase of polypeptide subunit release factors
MTIGESIASQLATEAGITAAAHALVGTSEFYIFETSVEPHEDVVEALRDLIISGGDPLGDALCAVRPSRLRRKTGQTFTPQSIVEFMMRSAEDFGEFQFVVDPGVGSGRFLRSAASAFPEARLIGVDTDPLSILISRAVLAVLGHRNRTSLALTDFRSLKQTPLAGRTLYIGNPPFVRHHDIDPSWKDWYAVTMSDLGIRKASRLAGMHLHFYAQIARLMADGDVGIFLTAAEWLDNRYGEAMRSLLRGRLGGRSVLCIAADSEPFPGTKATAAITTFTPGYGGDEMSFGTAATSADLITAPTNVFLRSDARMHRKKWSPLCGDPTRYFVRDGIRLGDKFKVSRGQVTGNNKVFIAGPDTPALPERFLIECVTAAQELFSAAESCSYTLDSRTALKRVVSLPANLLDLSGCELSQVRAFLEWAAARNAHFSHTAKSRQAWWSIPFHDSPPIIVTYMARRKPVFVRNAVGARLLNISHGVRPRTPMSTEEIDGYLDQMNAAAQGADGRTYAGGLMKFEPSDIADMLLVDQPPLSNEHSQYTLSEAA